MRREIEVSALPEKLPDQIEVDVTELDIHDTIHIEDLAMPEGVEALFKENFSVVTVVPPIVEAEPVAEEEEIALEGEAAAAEEGAVEEGAAPEKGE